MPRGTLFFGKVFRSGNSWVLVLERDLREALQLKPGDNVMIRVHAPYATFRRAVPELAIPISQLHAEDFPPAWPHTVKHANGPDDKAGAATRATGADAGNDGRSGAK